MWMPDKVGTSALPVLVIAQEICLGVITTVPDSVRSGDSGTLPRLGVIRRCLLANRTPIDL
jgi:hypothetical protein